MLSSFTFQTQITYFVLSNTNWEILKNIHAAVFHTIKMNGDQLQK